MWSKYDNGDDFPTTRILREACRERKKCPLKIIFTLSLSVYPLLNFLALHLISSTLIQFLTYSYANYLNFLKEKKIIFIYCPYSSLWATHYAVLKNYNHL